MLFLNKLKIEKKSTTEIVADLIMQDFRNQNRSPAVVHH